MTIMTTKTAMSLLVVSALSGCASTGHTLSPFSWFHRRDAAFAYTTPSSTPQSAIAASTARVPKVVATTVENSQTNATASSPFGSSEEMAAEWAARSASATSDSADSGYSSRREASCSSGCCSR